MAEQSIFAVLEHTMTSSLRVYSTRGAFTGPAILDGAQRLAAWLATGRSVRAPVISAFADIVGTTVVALAGDLAGIPVIHIDPSAGSLPPGIVVQGTPSPTLNGYADETLGIYADRPTAQVDLTGTPGGSQIFLSSGSTGTPIAAVRHAMAILADAERVADRLSYAAGDSIVVGAPVFHCYGFNYGLAAALLSGASVHFCGPHALPSQLARAVARSGARTLIGHPMQYRLLAQESARQQQPVVPGLAQAVSAGAPLPPGAAAQILQQNKLSLFNCYGSSEAGAVTLSPVDATEQPGDAGILLPGVDARIEDGELQLRTTSLACGYLGPRGLTPLRLQDGWYRTGDLAAVVGRRVLLHGRAANVINVGGEKVSPEQVARALAGHPAVADVDVAGEPDEARGQVPVAMVVLNADVTTLELLEWCRAQLAPYMVPRRIEIHSSIARSVTGKRLRGDQAAENRPTA